jgi:hypothetical protein
MEQNLAGCAKYYSYRSIEISRGSEFTWMEHNLGGISNTTLVEAQKS